MLNHQGNVAECTGDNLFIIKQTEPATLLTPSLDSGVLEGITRNTVLDLAREMNLIVKELTLTQFDLYTADEMFLTGSGAEIIPVTEIDKRSIGNGQVGPTTRRLITAFHDLVSDNAPEN